jgi:hypothetical protein
MYFHYGPAFTPPTDTRNWKPQPKAEELFRFWEQQNSVVRDDHPPAPDDTWFRYARIIKNVTEIDGYPEGSRIEFLHHLHSPRTIWFGPPATDAPAPRATRMDLSEAALAKASAEARKMRLG